MKQERKVSVLRNLLERVQKRAEAPRAASASPAVSSAEPGPVASGSFPAAASAVASAPLVAAAAPMGISAPPARPTTSARPGSSTLPLDFGSRGEAASFRPAPDAISQRPSAEPAPVASADAGAISDRSRASSPEIEADEGPPSAPRLREVPEEEMAAEEHETDEEEPPLKTPPPESGRQDVTPGPTVTINQPDEDISITVTMEESEAPPPVSPAPPEVTFPLSASRPDISEITGPQPRLALVSEPEIELHGMTPLSSVAEPVAPAKPPPAPEPSARAAPSSSFRPEDIDLAVPVPSSLPSVPSATPSGVRPVPPTAPAAAPAAPFFARTAASVGADTKPSVGAAPPMSADPVAPASPSAPPVRLMAAPQADASGKPMPPVEVWASTFTPAALRGQVASFVGHNANFEPKTFGELVRASVALGEETP